MQKISNNLSNQKCPENGEKDEKDEKEEKVFYLLEKRTEFLNA